MGWLTFQWVEKGYLAYKSQRTLGHPSVCNDTIGRVNGPIISQVQHESVNAKPLPERLELSRD